MAGEIDMYRFDVNQAFGGDLRVVLVFNDAAAAAGTGPVSDIDLEVTSPNGQVFKGNCFTAAPNAASSRVGCNFDSLNNEEVVFLPRAGGAVAAGTWSIRIIGQNLPLITPSPFALVITGPVQNLRGAGFSHVKGFHDTSSFSTSGAGVARVMANGFPRPDMLVMGIDSAATDQFRYRLLWDVDFASVPGSTSGTVGLANVDASLHATGGGVACAQLDADGRPDCIFAAVLDRNGEDQFNYFVGWNLQPNGAFAALMDSSQEMFKAGGDITHGGGVAIGNIGGGAELDVMFMMVDNGVSPAFADNYRYKICWDFVKDVAGGQNRGSCSGGKDANPRGGWEVGTSLSSEGDLVIADINGQGGLDVIFGVLTANGNTFRDEILYRVAFDIIGSGGQKGDFTTPPAGAVRGGKKVFSYRSTGLGMTTLQLDAGIQEEVWFDTLHLQGWEDTHEPTIGFNVNGQGWFS